MDPQSSYLPEVIEKEPSHESSTSFQRQMFDSYQRTRQASAIEARIRVESISFGSHQGPAKIAVAGSEKSSNENINNANDDDDEEEEEENKVIAREIKISPNVPGPSNEGDVDGDDDSKNYEDDGYSDDDFEQNESSERELDSQRLAHVAVASKYKNEQIGLQFASTKQNVLDDEMEQLPKQQHLKEEGKRDSSEAESLERVAPVSKVLATEPSQHGEGNTMYMNFDSGVVSQKTYAPSVMG